jgi:hypothetical protein
VITACLLVVIIFDYLNSLLSPLLCASSPTARLSHTSSFSPHSPSTLDPVHTPTPTAPSHSGSNSLTLHPSPFKPLTGQRSLQQTIPRQRRPTLQAVHRLLHLSRTGRDQLGKKPCRRLSLGEVCPGKAESAAQAHRQPRCRRCHQQPLLKIAPLKARPKLLSIQTKQQANTLIKGGWGRGDCRRQRQDHTHRVRLALQLKHALQTRLHAPRRGKVRQEPIPRHDLNICP